MGSWTFFISGGGGGGGGNWIIMGRLGHLQRPLDTGVSSHDVRGQCYNVI